MLDRIAAKTGSKPKPAGDGFLICCPSHEDHRESLSVGLGKDGNVLLRCHAGCETVDVLRSLGALWSDLFLRPQNQLASSDNAKSNRKIVATYDYKDTAGRLVFQVVRFDPKEFRQRRPDGNGGWIWNLKGVARVPYKLPELLAAEPEKPVFVVEGEKDVDRLAELGIVATTNNGGAGKWDATFAEHLAGQHVVILPDADDAGRDHSQSVAASLAGRSKSIRVCELPNLSPKGDVSDWLSAGGSADDLDRLAGQSPEWTSTGAQAAPRFKLNLISSADFAAADYRQRFLIRHVLTAGQPCILGGPKKCLKTSMMIDMAVSLGSATPFLGRDDFAVKEAVNVAILSGESGLATLQETARRVAYAHNVQLANCRIWWETRLPKIAKQEHLDALAEAIKENKIDVCGIDPAYLCLLSGDTQGRQASNVFDMGSILQGLADVGQETGCGFILAHHSRKNPAERFAVPELEELAFAGFSEFARQWVLLNRREQYEPGSGLHELWLAIGGSAGHSSCWALSIDEGVPDEEFRGRYWRPSVRPASEAIQQTRDDRERQRENDRHSRMMVDLERIVELRRNTTEPVTKNELKERLALNGKNFDAAFAEALRRNLFDPTTKKAGNGRSYPAFVWHSDSQTSE